MKKSNFLFIYLLAIFTISGCVTGTRHIEFTPVDYASGKSASETVYIGEIKDNRLFEQKP